MRYRIPSTLVSALLAGSLMATASALTIVPSPSPIYVDNQQVTPTAYLIDGNNFFKLRDLGRLINFGVSYDSATRSVQINPNESYVPESGESSVITNSSYAGATAKLTTQTILVNGQQVSPTVYTIDGNNFFKLRDLGDIVGFEVGYTPETKRVDITTNRSGNTSGNQGSSTASEGAITTWNTTMWQFHDAMISCNWDSAKYLETAKEYAPQLTGKQDGTVEDVIAVLESMQGAPVSAISFDDNPVSLYWAKQLRSALNSNQ